MGFGLVVVGLHDTALCVSELLGGVHGLVVSCCSGMLCFLLMWFG